jgi:hypothetical protein
MQAHRHCDGGIPLGTQGCRRRLTHLDALRGMVDAERKLGSAEVAGQFALDLQAIANQNDFVLAARGTCCLDCAMDDVLWGIISPHRVEGNAHCVALRHG